MRSVNYAKLDYKERINFQRYKRYVEGHGLLCQDCCGHGGEIDPVTDEGYGPWLTCCWCKGTGLVTRWLRGAWLRSRKTEVVQ